VLERSRKIARYLITQHRIKLLVIACNTATANAISELRLEYPDLPIIGVEPALKPAARHSQTRRVGVMATRGTLDSAKYKTLAASLPQDIEIVSMACDGLADAIERADSALVDSLCLQALRTLGSFGTGPGQIDQLVLGCTHYPLVKDRLRNGLPAQVPLVESGEPVALQTRRMLEEKNLAANGEAFARGTNQSAKSAHLWLTTGHPQRLQTACRDWLQLDVQVKLLQL
jgi:glutamate racemase